MTFIYICLLVLVVIGFWGFFSALNLISAQTDLISELRFKVWELEDKVELLEMKLKLERGEDIGQGRKRA
mgnify:CR=1 FL=1|nr:MAG TPA: cell division protein [Caudoviricetes sp.]